MALNSKGLHGYNQISIPHLNAALSCLPDLLNALKEADKSSENTFSIVDYGCSEGKNSMIVLNLALKDYRTISAKPVQIFHVDIPQNNWNIVTSILTTSEDSYLNLEETYFSTIGKSFFNQVVPSNTVNLCYSSFALHYLSKKIPRQDGEYGLVLPSSKPQAFADMTHLLNLRLKELVLGGYLFMIVNGRESEGDSPLAKYSFLPMKRLLDKGIISASELRNFVWQSYLYNEQEMMQVLQNFQNRIEIIKCEHKKTFYSYYADYLEHKNPDTLRKDLLEFRRVVMRPSVLSCLDRTDEEKELVFQKYIEEIGFIIDEGIEEMPQHFLLVIIKKLVN